MPNLPYFAVQFDYKGERGFGHVIEGVDDAPDRDLDGEERRGEMGDKGGGEFPRCVGSSVLPAVPLVERDGARRGAPRALGEEG